MAVGDAKSRGFVGQFQSQFVAEISISQILPLTLGPYISKSSNIPPHTSTFRGLLQSGQHFVLEAESLSIPTHMGYYCARKQTWGPFVANGCNQGDQHKPEINGITHGGELSSCWLITHWAYPMCHNWVGSVDELRLSLLHYGYFHRRTRHRHLFQFFATWGQVNFR